MERWVNDRSVCKHPWVLRHHWCMPAGADAEAIESYLDQAVVAHPDPSNESFVIPGTDGVEAHFQMPAHGYG